MRASYKNTKSALMATLVAALLCTGCRSRTSNQITAIPRDMAEAPWVSEHAGVAEAARQAHVRVHWNGPSGEDDVEQQITLAEKAIKNHDIGLILSPNSLFAMNTVIQQALRKNMPVVIVGSSIPLVPQQGLSFVLEDVEEAGNLVANRILKIAGSNAEVLVLGLNATWPGSVDREQAMERVLGKLAPGSKIVDRLEGEASFGQAELLAEQGLRNHPKTSVIVALNITSALGAVAALRTAGLAEKVHVIVFDQTFELLYGLRQGLIDSIVVQDMRTMGRYAIMNVLDARAGNVVPSMVRVKPMLVTRQNIDEEHVQDVLRMNWRPLP